MPEPDLPDALAAVGALRERTRRALYLYVAAQDHPVGRDEAARALQIPRHRARFHLDRLAEAGLLDVESRRPPGRGGPGAGHPAKLYRSSHMDVSVSVPQRQYELAGRVLARALTATMSGEASASVALEAAAAEAGRAMADARAAGLEAAVAVLDAAGFAPRSEVHGYVLRSCPFRALAQAAPDVVCRMAVALVAALLDAAGADEASADLHPTDGYCCVIVRTGA